ncbi:MAG: ABC transporter ATP-binding protein [Mycobacteriales bacterium]
MTRFVAARAVGVVRSGRAILQDVTVTAPAGEITALTGPSGSGKSTLIATLAGLEPVTTGAVVWEDTVVGPRSKDLRHRCGLVLQGYGLVSLLSAVENVELVLQAQRLPRAEVRDRAHEALLAVGLDGASDHLVEQLSGGQQQRVAVARAVVGRPEVLFADEPTAELDPATRDRVLHVLLAEARRGAVVVLATHDRYVADVADTEVELEDGRVR